jgi:hypothetical protein
LDRFYGETAELMDLPEASLDQLQLRNRDIPPFRGTELEEALKNLDSIQGLTPAQFWRTVDKCDCGQYFTKRALHDEHSETCPFWGVRSPSVASDTTSLGDLPSDSIYVVSSFLSFTESSDANFIVNSLARAK